MSKGSAFSAIHWKKPVAPSLAPEELVLDREPTAVGPFAAAPEVNVQELHPISRAIRKFGLPLVPDQSPKTEVGILLRAAAEVEHQLLVEYLYAVFSITDSADVSWRKALLDTAKEEMGHLLTVQNLLLVLGEPPHLKRLTPENTGQQPFPFTLQPASTLTLAKFTCIESPRVDQLSGPLRDRAKAAFELAKNNGFDFFTQDGVHQVGLLYARIYWLLKSSEAPEGPWADLPMGELLNRHVGDDAFDPTSVPFQNGAADWNVTYSHLSSTGAGIFVSNITNRADALQAIYDIAVQGEGPAGAISQVSHFLRFLSVFEGMKASETAGDTGNFRPLPIDPVFGNAASTTPVERQITELRAVSWCTLFDIQYNILVSEIALALRLKADDPQGTLRQLLAGHAVEDQMKDAINNVARKIISLPRKDGAHAKTSPAAPLFSDPLFPDETSRKKLAEWVLQLVARSLEQINQMQISGVTDALLETMKTGNASLRDEILIPVINLG